MKRKGFAAAGALLLSAAFSMAAWAGTWQYQEAGAPGPGAAPAGWKYQQADGSFAARGWVSDQGNWYYIGPAGIMETGWILADGSWYYLDDTGAMVSGAKKLINGVEYDFDASGALKEDDSGGWVGNTYTSSRFHYRVTVPDGFIPLDEGSPIYSDEAITLDMAAMAPDMTVSMTVMVIRDMDDELKGMNLKQFAEELKDEMADPADKAAKIEMVKLGDKEYAKLTLSYTDTTDQNLYLRLMGDSVMMIQVLYDPYKKDMADGIMNSFT